MYLYYMKNTYRALHGYVLAVKKNRECMSNFHSYTRIMWYTHFFSFMTYCKLTFPEM